MSGNILLTISILISNRPDTVRKCLDSVKPLLESIPSELILTDTGCGQQVRGIIEEYTDHIIDFEWCRDFSKARNMGMKAAKGKWFLFLDDDEWFEDVTEIIDFFRSGEYKKYGMCAYVQRNYLDMSGNVYTDLLVGRIIRLDPDIKFIYSIHEVFNRVPGEVKKLSAYVHHYGYVYKNKEEARAHSMRNISLLLEEHEANPRNMKHTLQLAQEYNAVENWEKSLEMSLDGIAWSRKGKIEESFCRDSMFANEIDCYIHMKRYEDAIQKGERYLREEKLDPLVRSIIAGDLVTSFIERGDNEKCLEYAHMYWDIYQDFLANEEAFMEFTTSITGGCFEPRDRSLVLGNGIRAAVHAGQTPLAWQWFQALEWGGNAVFVSDEMLRAIVSRVPDAEEEERTCYINMCDTILQRKELEGHTAGIILEVCEWYGDKEKPGVIASFGEIPSSHWFVKMAKLAMLAGRPEICGQDGACGNDVSQEAAQLAADIWEKMDESMLLMRRYGTWEAAQKLGVDRADMVRHIPFYIWRSGIENFYLKSKWEEIDWWDRQFTDTLSREDMHMLSWRAYHSAYSAKRKAGTGEDERNAESGGESSLIHELEKDLREYVECQNRQCERIYRPEVILQMPDMLPADYQAAYRIGSMLEDVSDGKYAQAVQTVKAIRKLLPGMDNVMKRYLRWISGQMEKQKQEAKQASGELQVLARQIKGKIRVLMEAGQNEAALAVADQLQALLPGDEEIRQIREKLKRG